MQNNRKPDWRISALWWLVFPIAASSFIGLAVLLSHGTAGGDEGGVLQFLADYRAGGWAALTAGQNGNDFLAHRLFWLGEKLVWEDLLRLILPVDLMARPAIYTPLMVLDDTIFMMLACGLSIWHLRKRWGTWVALLASAALFIASSGVGLFAGGFSECLMCLLVVIMATQLDRAGQLPLWRYVLVVLAGLGLIASKLYAAPFVLALTFILPVTRSKKLLYGAIFTVAPILWLVIQSEIQAGSSSGMLSFYGSLIRDRGDVSLLADGIAFCFSMSFGILPCFPLLLLAVFCGKAHHFSLAVEIAAVLGVSLILLSFPFWAGPGGLGGPRYIVPFLLVFLPEVAAGMRRLADTRHARALLLFVPISTVLFLPCLEYRNSLVTRYADDPRSVTDLSWPHTEPGMHPAILAWSVIYAKANHRPVVVFSKTLNLSAAVQDIFPMTTLSRVIYVLKFEGSPPERIRSVTGMLEQHKLDHVQFWQGLRVLLAALLLSALSLAAWPQSRAR